MDAPKRKRVIKLCCIAYNNMGTLRKLFEQLVKYKHPKFKFIYEGAIIGCVIPQNRNYCITREEGNPYPKIPGHIDEYMWIDTDLEPKFDQVIRLAEYDNYPIIGGYYRTQHLNQETYSVSINGSRLYAKPNFTDVREVNYMTAGYIKVDATVFHSIEFPFFNSYYNEHNILVYEDEYFCDKVRKFGYKIMCDFGIKIKHQLRGRSAEFNKQFQLKK